MLHTSQLLRAVRGARSRRARSRSRSGVPLVAAPPSCVPTCGCGKRQVSCARRGCAGSGGRLHQVVGEDHGAPRLAGELDEELPLRVVQLVHPRVARRVGQAHPCRLPRHVALVGAGDDTRARSAGATAEGRGCWRLAHPGMTWSAPPPGAMSESISMHRKFVVRSWPSSSQ